MKTHDTSIDLLNIVNWEDKKLRNAIIVSS